MEMKKDRKGAFFGFFIVIALAFLLSVLLGNIGLESNFLNYSTIVEKANTNIFYRLVWMVMNFTEPQFYAGFFASIMVILGGFVAWILDNRNSKYKGFDISYNSNMWPWVFASQILSLTIAIFVLKYTRYLDMGDYTWIPTFITVVGAPPSIILLFGPSISALLVSSIVGGLISFPIAFWIMTVVNPLFDFPGVVANVFAMAITGVIVTAICNSLSFVSKKENPKKKVERENLVEDNYKASWFVRRVLADFSEAQFYGNEIAGSLVIIGACVDWVVNTNHGTYGAKVLPMILLSQLIGSAVGVLLYLDKFDDGGWYATYVPVVSVGPACVLALGATMPVAILSGLLGGIIGAPLAEFINKRLPEGYHGTIGNVTSMGLTTIFVYNIIKVLI